MLLCMMKVPKNTITKMPTETQPNAIIAGPTCVIITPSVRAPIEVAVAAVAMCCQNTETKAKSVPKPVKPRITCLTGLLGKGLTSCSEPVSEVSVCQPGNVSNNPNARIASTMAAMLTNWSMSKQCEWMAERRRTSTRRTLLET
jgi:hypothetical protein